MRLLIVSPHFPPSNAADMQRVRLILPYLKDSGVEAEVLGVEAEQVNVPKDPWLVPGLPADVLIHLVKALGLKWARFPGLGILSFRALRALRRKGDELLRSGRFDLVYFSTTQFGIHVLGPYWKKRHSVPFVMDYQDPWVSDYYREHPEVNPPGGRLKYAITSWMSRRDEPRVLRECSGITSVSAAYPQQLENRYNFLKILPCGGKSRDEGRGPASDEHRYESFKKLSTVDGRLSTQSKSLPSLIIPFPGDERDFERVLAEGITQGVFDPKDGFCHWVYVGRGGKDMEMAARSLFRALKGMSEWGTKPEGSGAEDYDEVVARRATPLSGRKVSSNMKPDTKPCEFLKNLRIHFIGTSYAGAGRGAKSIEPIAVEEGLGEIVSEHPDRIPYSETLRCLLEADALVVPGSNDPAYTASKIYPYLLAGKPMLAVFHENSSVVSLIGSVGGGVVIPFAMGDSIESIAERIKSGWLACQRYEERVPLNLEGFAPYTAREQAGQLAEFLKSVLGYPRFAATQNRLFNI